MQLLRVLFLFSLLFIAISYVAAQEEQLEDLSSIQLPAEPLSAQEPNDIALAQLSSSSTVEGPTGRRPTAAGNKKPKDKLDVALAAIKQDIMVRNRQLEDEKSWVSEVHKITEQYNKKVHRVEADIVQVRNQVKELFKKKKQVENLKIQRQLESKLKDATSDLATLQQALHHVKSKSQEFEKTKNEIKGTIYGIHQQLAKLKGEKAPVKAPTDI